MTVKRTSKKEHGEKGTMNHLPLIGLLVEIQIN